MERREFVRLAATAPFWLAAPSVVRAHAQPVTVFRGGTVLPVDRSFSSHTALAIRGNRVLGTGSDEAMLALAGNGASVVDLDGRTLLPGFIEPHLHLTLLAALADAVDIGPFEQPTFDGAVAALRESTQSGPNTEGWIMGRQFDPSLLEPLRALTVKELDEISTDRPVFVLNASGHVAYVNSVALGLTGFTEDSEAPSGASFGRFEDGSLNGVLFGQAAFIELLFKNPEIKTTMGPGFGTAVAGVSETVAAYGITTMTDMAAGAANGMGELQAILAQADAGNLSSRIRSFVYDPAPIDPEDLSPMSGTDLARVVGWKIVSDGSNQGFTGRQRAPYHSELTLGLYYVRPADLIEQVDKIARAGWPLAIHGNGDAAIDSILNAVEYTTRKGFDMKGKRTRIEHASILDDASIARMVQLGVHPSFLINHVHYWGHVMRDKVFGPEKVLLLDRCAAAEEAGLTWTMHTDAPVSPLGSLHKIRVAVARDLWKEPESILAPDERVSVEQAIRSVTLNAAWQCSSEQVIGSLEEGKLADMVILEEDPRRVEPSSISDIKVSETWMDGQQVYSA